jgi:hypothetical protein
MIELLIVGVAVGGCAGAYYRFRRFVRERLRFVDVVQDGRAPVVVGGLAALAAAPVVWVLPVVGAGTALAFGAGVGLAVRHGARDIRTGRYLIADSGS